MALKSGTKKNVLGGASAKNYLIAAFGSVICSAPVPGVGKADDADT